MNFMERAAELARMGEGFTNPNPLVGAVIVKDGKIIGEGYHKKYGEAHAEVNALASCTESPEGADMYVTLEPCCHTGKQPPCTDAVIAAGIKRVFIGSRDPNPLVSGKGAELLRNAGIEVTEDFERELCDALNPIFFKFITTGTPYVILKTAVTADGRTAAASGDSKWITNEKSRENVHLTRRRVAAVMTGIGTVLRDDPELTCRIENPKNPIRIICDSSLRIPMDSRIVKTATEAETIIATLSHDFVKTRELESLGIHVIKTREKDGEIDLSNLMTILGKMNIDSVLIEAGQTLNASAFEAGIIDLYQLYIAPKLIGGQNAKSPIGGRGIAKMSAAVRLGTPKVRLFDGDVMLEYEVIKE